MGLADVLRPETWFDVYDGRGSFRVQLPGVSVKPQSSNTSALDSGRVEAANRLLQPFILEADFLGELPRIIVAWRDRKTPTAAGGIGTLNALLPSLKTATGRQLIQYLAEKSEFK